MTTSIHCLNGDKPLPFGHAGKLGYFLLNWLNNRLPDWRVDPGLVIQDFRCPNLESYWPQLPTGASPSRILSDLFWLTLPWERIQQELGGIRILDAGCGSGHYGPRLISWSGDRVASYIGADIHAHESWPALEHEDQRMQFIQADAGELGRVLPGGTNLIMSQSAIEHMDHDLQFFEHVCEHVQRLGNPRVAGASVSIGGLSEAVLAARRSPIHTENAIQYHAPLRERLRCAVPARWARMQPSPLPVHHVAAHDLAQD